MNWSNDQYAMANIMGMQGMPPMQNMMHNMMPMQYIPQIPNMMPDSSINMNNNQGNIPSDSTKGPLIGPTMPKIEIAGLEKENDVKSGNFRDNNDRRNSDNRRDRDKDNRSRRRSRSGDRRDRSDRRGPSGRRERASKWDNDQNKSDNMVNPGVMQFGNMMNQQQMEIGNMAPNMGNMPNMSSNMGNMPHNMGNMSSMPTNIGNVPSNMVNMQNMPNALNMMQGLNMMDPNMMMMNQQPMMMPNQPIFISIGVLMPPIVGVAMPQRRERPDICRTIFIGGLPIVEENVLKEIFPRFGNVVDVKIHKQGFIYVQYEKQESVEEAFLLSGWRFKYHEQTDNEATTIFVDYALNREDQNEASRRRREPPPPLIEPFSTTALEKISEKIKSEHQFTEAAPTLVGWLERGECNKRNANTFYSLIQASNGQVRRLFNEKMALDETYQTMKTTMKDQFAHIVTQFEQVAKILSTARHQRVSDHFTKQQRRNVEMWLKMTEEVENIREEFNANFDEEEMDKSGKNLIPEEKYELLRQENDNLIQELEGYKNEAHLAKDEAERKFEKFKAHFIAQQALQNKTYPPLPPSSSMSLAGGQPPLPLRDPRPPPPPEDFNSGPVQPSDAKIIAILTAFLIVHPLGVTLENLVAYVRSMFPLVAQRAIQQILQTHSDIFRKKITGGGDQKWNFVMFDTVKSEFGRV